MEILFVATGHKVKKRCLVIYLIFPVVQVLPAKNAPKRKMSMFSTFAWKGIKCVSSLSGYKCSLSSYCTFIGWCQSVQAQQMKGGRIILAHRNRLACSLNLGKFVKRLKSTKTVVLAQEIFYDQFICHIRRISQNPACWRKSSEGRISPPSPPASRIRPWPWGSWSKIL